MRKHLIARMMLAGLAVVASQDSFAQAEKGWITLRADKEFSIQAPPGTKYRPDRGIDSFVGGFTNPAFKIQFDYGWYSPTLSEFRSDKRFTIQALKIDGHLATMATGPGEKEWGCTGKFTAIYVVVSQQDRLYMSGCTRDRTKIETLQTIFRSIKFLK